MKPTLQQEAIYTAIRSGKQHLMVSALAGTGKTTTAIGAIQSAGDAGRTGFVAFNQHIARELQSRLPAGAHACTLHSLGFAACRQAFPGVQVDEAKLTKLMRQVAPVASVKHRQLAEQLARLCKYTLSVPKQEALDALCEHHGIEVDNWARESIYALARALLSASAEDQKTIDFDDMVWFPACHDLPVDQFDLLIVDEAQDLNRAQQELALAAVNSGRLCPIGDENQAIYGFSGADSDSLPRLREQLAADSQCLQFPLTITWRCPRSHVALARRIVSTLEASPTAIEGVIATQSEEEIVKNLRPGDLVISRKNAPAVSMTYRLVLAGIPAIMRGRDIGKGLLSLLTCLDPVDVADLIRRIEEYRERETTHLLRQNASTSRFDSLDDRCDCLSQLARSARSLDDLRDFIGRVFSDHEKPGNAVVLSSIHRAKGLEADTVYVLDPASLPLIRRDSKPWQRVQEHNLCYIAATRAKQSLIFENEIPGIFQ